MIDEQQPGESDSVLSDQRVYFPVNVAKGVFEETSDVLESSPFLGHITRFSSVLNELAEITFSCLGKSSIYYNYDMHYSFIKYLSKNELNLPSDHVGALVDVGHSVEETLNTSDPLSEMTLGVVSLVQVLSHIILLIYNYNY